MHVALEHPNQSELVALVQALDAYQTVLYPPESHHGIDMAALAQPNVLFAVARDAAGAAVGCGAVVLGPEFGELKRMYVTAQHRRGGVAQALLSLLEAQSVERGCTLLMLETGARQPEALALYLRCGYVRCGPFADYTDDPHSVFMCKPLAGARSP